MKYRICKIEKLTVCVPSSDYYARGGDTQEQDIDVLQTYDEFDSHDEAVQHLVSNKGDYSKGEFTIMPIFTIK